MRKVIRWILCGVLYGLMEIAWRGRTHWTMVVLAAVLAIPLDIVNDKIPWKWPLWGQAIAGGTAITAAELVAGIFLNCYLKLNIWNYSNLWGNLWGQICPQYWALWCLLAGPVIVAFDWLDYWNGGDHPRYHLGV